jgi:cytochrome P450
MVKEVLRWKTVAISRAISTNRRGRLVRGHVHPERHNLYPEYMNHDPEVYGENAMHFDLERHLDAKGNIAPGPSDAKGGTPFLRLWA